MASALIELERYRVRRSLLPSELPLDSTWMILVDLFVRQLQGGNAPLSARDEMTGTSKPTLARHIAALIEAGLVIRQHRQGTADEPPVLVLTSRAHLILAAIFSSY